MKKIISVFLSVIMLVTSLCFAVSANASVNKTHSYAQGSISALKNNAYFKGGQSYPIEEYLRGVCYVKLTVLQLPKYPVHLM